MAKEKFSVFTAALTEDTTPDTAADFVVTYDASATTSKKVKPTNLVGTVLAALRSAFTPASSSGPASLQFAEDTDNGTNKITVIGQSSLAADRTLTLPDATDTLVGKATTDTLTNKTLTTPVISGAISFPDDVRQTFNPGTNNAGLNVGALAGDPGTPSNGDLWYDSTANELTARINGANVALGAGGGGGVTGSGTSGNITKWTGSGSVGDAAGLAIVSGTALKISAQASGDTALELRGNTSDDDKILILRRGSTDTEVVSWSEFGDELVTDRSKTYQYSGTTYGGWHPTQGGFMATPNAAYCFTNASNFNTIDGRIYRVAASIIGIDNNSSAGAALQFIEQTAPAAGAANTARIYAQDNGSGKTQLMVIFSSGAAQQIAIQP